MKYLISFNVISYTTHFSFQKLVSSFFKGTCTWHNLRFACFRINSFPIFLSRAPTKNSHSGANLNSKEGFPIIFYSNLSFVQTHCLDIELWRKMSSVIKKNPIVCVCRTFVAISSTKSHLPSSIKGHELHECFHILRHFWALIVTFIFHTFSFNLLVQSNTWIRDRVVSSNWAVNQVKISTYLTCS